MQKKTKAIAAFVTVVIFFITLDWFIGRNTEKTDDATVEAHVVAIVSKVPGYIKSLDINDNQKVLKNDVLLEIDPADYNLKLDIARAHLASSEVKARNKKINAERQQAIGKAAGTQKDIDNAVAEEEIALSEVDSAKSQLALSEKDLSDTKIIAPIDGTVTMRTVEQGSYANVGSRLFMLVGTEKWVVANFKEVQITNMRPGQEAIIELDAYPDLKIQGHVDSIQSGTGSKFSAFPAENATGNFVKVVQRVPVKIVIDTALPQDLIIGPGLSANVKVYTKGK